jgi:tRNA threonylcarbamoyladenosine biosynthesis protein TsaE
MSIYPDYNFKYKFFLFCKEKKDFRIFSTILSNIYMDNNLIFLFGNIGVGKTFFSKVFIGNIIKFSKIIKSPTFSLMETYKINDKAIYHFDFFNIKNIFILKKLNLDIIFNNCVFSLLEWSNKFYSCLPNPSHIFIFLSYSDFNRIIIMQSDFLNFNKLFKI